MNSPNPFKQKVCFVSHDGDVHVRSFRGKKYILCNDKYEGNIKEIQIGDYALVERKVNMARPYMCYYLVGTEPQEIGAKI